jgi:hypothetical protein
LGPPLGRAHTPHFIKINPIFPHPLTFFLFNLTNKKGDENTCMGEHILEGLQVSGL